MNGNFKNNSNIQARVIIVSATLANIEMNMICQ